MTEEFIPALRFHRLTKFYDGVVKVTTREAAIKKEMVEGLGQPRRLLDIGCGTGTLLSLIGAAYPNAELFGIDADATMVPLAKTKVGTGVRIELGDATEPDFESGSFDHVVSSLVFHHLTDDQKLRSLRSIRELLCEDGEFFLADWCNPHDWIMRGMFFVVQLLDGFETTNTHVVEGGLIELFHKAGFREVEETFRQRTPLGSMSIIRGRK